MKQLSKYLVLTLAAAQLAACTTTGSTSATDPKGQTTEIKSDGSLASLELQYKRNSAAPEAALAYASALRKENYQDRAKTVLAPFAREKKAIPGIKSEMAAIELALGNHDAAENYAKQAVVQDPADYLAYQNLGVALDAKGMHPEAERAFRKGLESWKGDPTSIMNNLALNLATQGFIEEAVEILEKAKALNPDRIEIERNLRIVRTMNER